jgi:Flp pilus assembly protein TadD
VALLGIGTNLDLGLDNGLGAWRAEMILHQISTGQDLEADALLARAEPMHPNRSLLLYRAGRAWLARGDMARALTALERAQAAAPERKEIDLEIGKALLALGRAREAVDSLKAAREVPGHEDEARVALAQALAISGQAQEALGELAALRAPEALGPASQVAAGRLALELGQARVAEPFLERAVKAAPDDPELGEAYGLALATSGKREQAIAALEEVARLDSRNAGVRMNLAILYADAGRTADARRLAVEALRIRPDEPRAREFLASLPPGR